MERIRDYTVVDLEMTGLSVKENKIIEIGAVRVRGGQAVQTYAALVNPGFAISPEVENLTGITNDMLAEGGQEDVCVQALLDFIGADVVVGQNISFDYRFVKQWAVNRRIPLEWRVCDTLKLARSLLPKEQSKRLDALCAYFGIERRNAHRAGEDAAETWQLFERLAELAKEAGRPELLEPKLLQIKCKRQTPATPHQIERLKRYMESRGIAEEIRWETLTRSEASRKIDLWNSEYGK